MKRVKSKTTFRELLAIELLEVCTKINESQHPEATDAKSKFSKAKVKELSVLAEQVYSSSENGKRLMKFAAMLLDAPELGAIGNDGKFNLFSVVAFKKNVSRHGRDLNKPFIVTHTDNRLFLEEDGSVSNRRFDPQDEPYLVSDEEVAKCIGALTDAQWKTIASNAIFAPLTQALLDREIELVDTKKKEKVVELPIALPKVTEEPAF